MNEDDIQIQPSAMPPEPDDVDAGGAVPTGPGSPPSAPSNAEMPAEAAQEEEPPVEKIVDITDDFKITPLKEEPTPVHIAPVKTPPKPTESAPKPAPSIPMPQKIAADAIPANNSSALSAEERAAENARRMGIDQILHKLNLPAQPGASPRAPLNGSMPKPNKFAMQGKLSPDAPQQKAIRTYEGDVAEVLAHRKSSTASIAIAESRKNTGEERIRTAEESTQKPHAAARNILITLASLLLVGGGAVGAYYLYSLSPLAPSPHPAEQPQAAPSLIPSDSQVAIAIDNMDPGAVISAVRAEMNKPQPGSTIKEIVLVQTKNGQHFRVSGPDMANIMDTGAPDILLRALADGWMLGVSADANGTKTVFVVATIDYFQNAFAGMLQWEALMADDLKQYLYPSAPSDVTTAAIAMPTAVADALTNPLANMDSILPMAASSSAPASSSPRQGAASRRGAFSEGAAANTAQATASPLQTFQASMNGATASTSASTTSMATPATAQTSQPYVVLRGSFVDRIIRNKDVREFVGSDGKPIFLYSFIDNTKLVVAGSEAALTEIVNRLEQQAFVR